MFISMTFEASLIRAFLAHGADHQASIEATAAAWRMARITVRCVGEGGLADHPAVGARVRGAWGRALSEGASAEALEGGPCPWPAPCAYDLFFNAQGHLTARLELPKPFVLSLEAEGRDLVVTLTLFGIAADWAGEAADALVRALRGGLDMGSDRRLALNLIRREVAVSEGLPLPEPDQDIVLEFRTPLVLRQDQAAHADPASLITSLANRVSGLARWHGLCLDVPGPSLAVEAARLAAGARWHDPARQSWVRGSKVQGRRMLVQGVSGRLTLPPAGKLVSALLAMGEHCHAGGRATSGMGRYTLRLSKLV